MNFITRIRTNMKTMRVCFSLMWQHKIFLAIPLLKGAVLAGVTVPLGFLHLSQFGLGTPYREFLRSPITGSISLFSLLLIMILTIFLFNIIALTVTHLTLDVLAGKKVSLARATKKSFSRIPTVALWSTVQLAVAAVLSLVRGEGKKSNGGIRRMLSSLLGASWHVVTFFMYPVLATQNLNVRDSLQRSYSLLKEKFGDVVIAMTAFNVMSIVPLLLLFFFYRLFPRFAFFGFDIRVIWISVVVMFLFTLLITTAKTIFKTAIYCFATGRPMGSFSRSDLRVQIINR